MNGEMWRWVGFRIGEYRSEEKNIRLDFDSRPNSSAILFWLKGHRRLRNLSSAYFAFLIILFFKILKAEIQVHFLITQMSRKNLHEDFHLHAKDEKFFPEKMLIIRQHHSRAKFAI